MSTVAVETPHVTSKVHKVCNIWEAQQRTQIARSDASVRRMETKVKHAQSEENRGGGILYWREAGNKKSRWKFFLNASRSNMAVRRWKLAVDHLYKLGVGLSENTLLLANLETVTVEARHVTPKSALVCAVFFVSSIISKWTEKSFTLIVDK